MTPEPREPVRRRTGLARDRAAPVAVRRLGVFDSGVGGLTVVASLRQAFPGLDVLYLGDTARLPYGTKSEATVRRYTERNVRYLASRGVDGVIVACNSASAVALDGLESELPVWGVVRPGARLAAEVGSRRVGVIATETTVRSGAYERALHALRPELEVTSRACPMLVPLVEEGWVDEPLTDQVVARYLRELVERRIDTLVLGCTHYPLLRRSLRRVVGDEVALVDSGAALAGVLSERIASSGGAGSLEVLVTDDSPGFARLARAIVGREVELEWLDPHELAAPEPAQVTPRT